MKRRDILNRALLLLLAAVISVPAGWIIFYRTDIFWLKLLVLLTIIIVGLYVIIKNLPKV